MLLEDRNSVIFGAGGSIGGAVGRAFAGEGARVFLAGRTLTRLDDLARLRRVRDRIDWEYAQPLGVEALARGAHMSAGHLQQPVHRAGRCAAQRLSAPGCAHDGGDAVLRGEAGDQTDQESRSEGTEPQVDSFCWTE